jgi:hypothetical protein
MDKLTAQQILDLLINLTPDEIKQIVMLLGPCQGAMDLYEALNSLQDLKS